MRTGLIKSSKATNRSVKFDLRLGPGVYATSLDPSHHTKDEILRNNYRPMLQTQMRAKGKADFFVRLTKMAINNVVETGTKVYTAETEPGKGKIFVFQDLDDQRIEMELNRQGYDFSGNRSIYELQIC